MPDEFYGKIEEFLRGRATGSLEKSGGEFEAGMTANCICAGQGDCPGCCQLEEQSVLSKINF